MWEQDDAPTVRLRERMRDAQAEMDKVQERQAADGDASASGDDVERLLRCRNASRELNRILGSR